MSDAQFSQPKELIRANSQDIKQLQKLPEANSSDIKSNTQRIVAYAISTLANAQVTLELRLEMNKRFDGIATAQLAQNSLQGQPDFAKH